MSRVVEIRDVSVDNRHLLAVWISERHGERIFHVLPSHNAPEHGEQVTLLGNMAYVGANNRALGVIKI